MGHEIKMVEWILHTQWKLPPSTVTTGPSLLKKREWISCRCCTYHTANMKYGLCTLHMQGCHIYDVNLASFQYECAFWSHTEEIEMHDTDEWLSFFSTDYVQIASDSAGCFFPQRARWNTPYGNMQVPESSALVGSYLPKSRSYAGEQSPSCCLSGDHETWTASRGHDSF